VFNTFSDPYINVAFRIGVAVGLLTLAFVVAIVALRIHRLWQDRHERAFLAHWRGVLMQLVLAPLDEAPMPRLARADQWRFLKLWNQFLESLRGASADRLRYYAYRLGCHEMATQLLEHRGRAERVFAILTLGHMRYRPALAPLLVELGQSSMTTSLYAARALLQIDSRKASAPVVAQLLRREDWEMVRIVTALRDFQAELGKELFRVLPELPPDPHTRALKLIGAFQLHVGPALLRPWLHPDQPAEKLIACLRIVSDGSVLGAVRELAHHPQWPVRVQAARTLGRLAQPADVPLLISLLADPQWWVRYRSARALTNLPFLTREELRTRFDQLPDRFAREMAIQVLAETRNGR